MSLIQVESICEKCTFQVTQEINLENSENYIHCPCCDNVYQYVYSDYDNNTKSNQLAINISDLSTTTNPSNLSNQSNGQNTHDEDESYEFSSPLLENMAKAYSEIPHIFIESESIFMKGHINGVEIDFLLDTGAEMSLIPYDIAHACGLDGLINSKYSGIIKGAGETQMLGRIFYVEVVFDCGIYPCSFSVCQNNNLPPILGIDMMHNLGLVLDFKKKKIHFDDNCSIDFISRKHNNM